jgi:hypothetical protein
MRTEEIAKLSRKLIADLIHKREQSEEAVLVEKDERRQHPRWPFPGAIEIWLSGNDAEQRWFASCANLSRTGIGMFMDRPLEAGMAVELACHFPAVTVCGGDDSPLHPDTGRLHRRRGIQFRFLILRKAESALEH